MVYDDTGHPEVLMSSIASIGYVVFSQAHRHRGSNKKNRQIDAACPVVIRVQVSLTVKFQCISLENASFYSYNHTNLCCLQLNKL